MIAVGTPAERHGQRPVMQAYPYEKYEISRAWIAWVAIHDVSFERFGEKAR
jgi:hypothetical protein